MTGQSFNNNDNKLSEGAPATHIGPETGDTARATAGEGSSAGTHGSQPSPPDAANIGRTNPHDARDGEERSFQGGQDGIPGTPSEVGAEEESEALKNVSDGDD